MARKFSELRDKMSPERRARNETAEKKALAEMPLNELRNAEALKIKKRIKESHDDPSSFVPFQDR